MQRYRKDTNVVRLSPALRIRGVITADGRARNVSTLSLALLCFERSLRVEIEEDRAAPEERLDVARERGGVEAAQYGQQLPLSTSPLQQRPTVGSDLTAGVGKESQGRHACLIGAYHVPS